MEIKSYGCSVELKAKMENGKMKDFDIKVSGGDKPCRTLVKSIVSEYEKKKS